MQLTKSEQRVYDAIKEFPQQRLAILDELGINDNNLKVHVSKLRAKGVSVMCVWGKGYIVEGENDAE